MNTIYNEKELKILKKLANPPDENYNFGYYKLEPILVNSQGALMIAGAMIGIIFAFGYWKGEKPRWQWSSKE